MVDFEGVWDGAGRLFGRFLQAVRDVEACAYTDRARALTDRVSELVRWTRLAAAGALAYLAWQFYLSPPPAEVFEAVRADLTFADREAKYAVLLGALALPLAGIAMYLLVGFGYNLVRDAVAARLPRAFRPLVGPALLVVAVATAYQHAQAIDDFLTYRYLQALRVVELANGEPVAAPQELKAVQEYLDRAARRH